MYTTLDSSAKTKTKYTSLQTQKTFQNFYKTRQNYTKRYNTFYKLHKTLQYCTETRQISIKLFKTLQTRQFYNNKLYKTRHKFTQLYKPIQEVCTIFHIFNNTLQHSAK